MPASEGRVLALIEDVLGLTELPEFRVGLLEALLRAVPSDIASLNDLGPGPRDASAVVIPPPPADAPLKAFARYKDQHPIANYHARTHDGRAYRFSDVISARELRRLPIYQHVYAPLGINHQIAFTLPADPGRLLGVALSRRERNYSNAERELLNRARPALIEMFRTAIEHQRLTDALIARPQDGHGITQALHDAGLTPREAEVINAIAHGHSPRATAAMLNIRHRTVTKHLEHSFRKLEVTSQTDAAAKAWAMVVQRPG